MKNKCVYITGASSGIGAELAYEYARRGFAIGLLARRLPQLEEVKALALKDAPAAKIEIVSCDVREKTAVVAAFAALKAKLGAPDILIANAGIADMVGVDEYNTDTIDEIFRVNVLGVNYCIAAVLPDMLAAQKGHIVGIASLAAYHPFPHSHPYGASKAALTAQLEGLRVELLPRGVKVTTICPGFIRTPMTDRNSFKMPFLLDPAPSAAMICDAIAAGKAVYNFPRRTYALVRLAQLMPRSVLSRFFAGQTLMKAKPKTSET